jgi:hypothetical protein
MTSVATMTQRTSIDPLGAGALLATVLAVCLGIGVAVGALVGVPASIAAVVLRYRGS